jgi:tricorn protease
MYAIPFESYYRQRAKTGLLGVDYSVDQGRYRFARIYEGDPWNPAARSALNELERRVEVGEYLLTVNGREVRPSEEVFSFFENTAGRTVVLTVGPEPDGRCSRQITVVPLDDEYPLRYFAWIEGNRRKVDELSAGRVAYVHLPDCRLAGYAAFTRYFFAQADKEAAIIDARYNNGGHLPDHVIDCLNRPLMYYWHMREGQDAPGPSLSIFGPKVMLINEMAGSAGDLLPWMFRKAGIGPSIGKRSWGGLVGHYAVARDLLDHGLLGNPNFAFYTPEGEWEVENCGVSPDIEVEEDPKAAREGRDVQLERAVEVVMDLLKTNPPPKPPKRPPFPRYHGKT